MPYNAPGVRVKKTNGTAGAAASSTLKHGDIVNYEGMVGVAHKSGQVDRWTLPANAAKIAAGEEFVLGVGGVVEMALAAPNPTTAAVGNLVNVAVMAGGTASVLTIGAAGPTTIGVVQSIDTTRTPNVARINTNFQPGAA